MLKGIPQSKRDNAWHIKHLRQLTAKKALRKTRLFNYVHGFTSKNRMEKLEERYKLAQQKIKEEYRKLPFFTRLKLFLKNLFRIKNYA